MCTLDEPVPQLKQLPARGREEGRKSEQSSLTLEPSAQVLLLFLVAPHQEPVPVQQEQSWPSCLLPPVLWRKLCCNEGSPCGVLKGPGAFGVLLRGCRVQAVGQPSCPSREPQVWKDEAGAWLQASQKALPWPEEDWGVAGKGTREVKLGVVEVTRKHNSLITFI